MAPAPLEAMVAEMFEVQTYLSGRTHVEKWLSRAARASKSARSFSGSFSRSFSRRQLSLVAPAMAEETVASEPEPPEAISRSSSQPDTVELDRRARIKMMTGMVRLDDSHLWSVLPFRYTHELNPSMFTCRRRWRWE